LHPGGRVNAEIVGSAVDLFVRSFFMTVVPPVGCQPHDFVGPGTTLDFQRPAEHPPWYGARLPAPRLVARAPVAPAGGRIAGWAALAPVSGRWRDVILFERRRAALRID